MHEALYCFWLWLRIKVDQHSFEKIYYLELYNSTTLFKQQQWCVTM